MRPKQTSKPHEQEAIELYPLPDSWRWGTVADAGADQKHAIVDGPFGSNLKLSDYVKDGTVPVLTTKNLEGNYDNVRYISKEKFAELKRSAVYPGDILMAKIGSCGKTGIYPPNMPVAMIPANLLKVSLKENFHLRYVYYYFNCSFFQKVLKTITKATAQPAFGVTNFRRLPLPVPPLDQQTLIVSEIEKQFSRLDEAVAALKRVRASLKRYKAAVLKAAVEGRLTEEWRKQNPDVEPADKLLKRILAERKKKWEEANPKKKYKEPSVSDTLNLPELPRGWVRATVEQLYDIIGGGTPSTKISGYWDGKTPWITSADIYGVKDIRPRKQITKEAIKNSATNLVPKGSLIVVTRVGLGKIAITNTPLCFSQDSQALVDNNSLLFSVYSLYYLSNAVQRFKYEHRGTTIAGVTKKQLADLEFAIPPLPEQKQIVEEIESRLSVAEEIEEAIDINLKRAERLRQAVLKKAFSGKLV